MFCSPLIDGWIVERQNALRKRGSERELEIIKGSFMIMRSLAFFLCVETCEMKWNQEKY